MINTITGYLNGETIEMSERQQDPVEYNCWQVVDTPEWNWLYTEYRIRKEAKLCLEARGNKLCILFNGGIVGSIAQGNTGGGRCHFVSSQNKVLYRKAWRDNGKLVCCSDVAWRGRVYYLGNTGILYSKSSDASEVSTMIYSFEECLVYTECADDNLERFENGRIINY